MNRRRPPDRALLGTVELCALLWIAVAVAAAWPPVKQRVEIAVHDAAQIIARTARV